MALMSFPLLYPAHWLLALFVSHGVDVVMGMSAAKVGASPESKRFLASGAKTAVIDCMVVDDCTITVRLIRRCAHPSTEMLSAYGVTDLSFGRLPRSRAFCTAKAH